MVNTTLESGSPEHLRSTIEMVEKQTDVLEAVGGSEIGLNPDIDTPEETSLGNPPRIRKRGGVSVSISQERQKTENSKQRTTRRCGNCGTPGHNWASYKVVQDSQTFDEESHGYADVYCSDVNEEFNIVMVCIVPHF
ncbi:unnamed protein product [Lathyrus sativus]|nr:unnamed protein product [Lathyrus sativus]